jgi:hypothetical protein
LHNLKSKQFTLSYDSFTIWFFIKHIVKESHDKVYVILSVPGFESLLMKMMLSQKSDKKFCRSRRNLVGLSHHRLCCCCLWSHGR